ncbi:Por secretion system C-terminal sorting domain-containing protein [Aquiflexum balticum DSM 16537]|uniref:Por secretion system C-terminal sorting domain-containing protein n=1 Tax=Aquiflexum balticum DSM 16537 TaxID=758820 RepID=A0A1W2H9H6_9BACT|nr:HYR domain-containing protein [Aquiflexum balticum]SMD45535.1 Por secretion system C-terminal sorting domain-containing protein [Aquiflexum balticum DSM 16537]
MKLVYPRQLFIFIVILFAWSRQGFGQQTTVNFDGYTENQGLSNPHVEGELRFEAIKGASATCTVCIGIDINEGKNLGPGLDDSNQEIGGIIGWKISRADDASFQFLSIWLQDRDISNALGTSDAGTIKAFKGGAQVGSTKAINFDSGTSGLKTFATDPDFFDVDHILIEGSDLFLILDDVTYNVPFMDGSDSAPTVLAVNLIGAPISTATSVTYNVEFSKIAENVSVDDFELTNTGTATGTIASVSGSNATYSVLITGLSGEGNIRLDIKAGTDISNENNVTGTAAFTSGQIHHVSPCLIEDFEDETDASKSFSIGANNFSITGNLEVHTETPTIGINGSRYVLLNTGLGPYVINSLSSDINLKKFAVFLSSDADGNNPTNDGSITVIGKKDGSQVYSITKSSGFPEDFSANSGYYIFDLRTEGGADNSTILIDQLEISLGSAFQYINIDNFEFCLDLDAIAPVISDCPTDISVSNAEGVCSAAVTWTAPTASDDSGSVSFTSNFEPGAVFPVGTTEVIYTATDPAGNQATCSFNVTVNDITPPVLVVQDVTYSLPSGGFFLLSRELIFQDIIVKSQDNCGIFEGENDIEITKVFFDCEEIGDNEMSIKIKDINGNVTSSSFILTITDPIAICNQPPVAVAKPLTVSADANCEGSATAVDFDGGSTDADGDQLSFSVSPVGPYPLGVTNVKLSVSDGFVTSQASTTITVKDTTPPVVTCQNIEVALGADGTFSINSANFIFDNILTSYTDNCTTAPSTVGITKSNFDCNDLGADVPVTIFIRDGNGNETACSFTVKVTDPLDVCNQPPVAVAKPLTISADANCEGIATAADFDGGSFDPDGDVISFGVFPAAPYSLGTTSVTLMVTDSKGATSTATTTITVEDKTDPVVTVPANILVENDPGQCGAIVTLTASASDNCSGITLVMNVDDGKDIFTRITTPLTGDAFFPVGTTTVTVDATDAAGNKAIQKSFTVTVIDSEAPVITVITPTPTAVLGLTNTVTLLATDIFAATDKCSGDLVFSPTVFTFDCDDLGENIVSVSVTDAAGNTANANATVTISDNVALSIDASESGTPVPLGSDAVLKATVSPAVEGVEVTFSLDNGTYEKTALTDGSGIAAITVLAAELGAVPVVYKVSATIVECTGLVESVAYLPIFDPNGNFVTGGGWIMSPVGAYKADESLTGKANFGFVSKYKKGSNRVDGNTEFQFKAGDLNFKSTLHESGTLVISGKKATYRGEGTINDVPGYNFTLVALDGNFNGESNPDQFRIKIWGASGIVYDNGLGADDNSDVSTVLGGGSITIHEAKGKGKDVRREITDPTDEELENSFEDMELSDEPSVGEFRLYPNPAQKETSVMVDLDQGATVAIRIYDAVGRLVLENEAYREESFVQTFNLDGLAAGFYTVQVKAGDILMIKRLIKE